MAGESLPTERPADADTSLRPFFIGCFILLLAVWGYGLHVTHDPKGWTDFRVYYAAGTLVRTHPSMLYDWAQQVLAEHPYNPKSFLLYIHPSYEAPLFVPFSLLPYRAALLIYMAFSVLLVIATFFIARPIFSVKIPYLQPRPGLMLVLFLPLIATIAMGQDCIIFLLLCCLTWRQLERSEDLSAGCILALGLFRFHIAIPLAILLALRRGWRFFAGFLATGTALAVLSIAIVGRTGTMQYLDMLIGAGLFKDQGLHARQMMGIFPLLMPNLAGMLYAGGTRLLSPHAALAVVTSASLCVYLWTIYRMRREPQESAAFAMAILCSTLVSYHFYVYELVLIVLPLALLVPRVHYSFLVAFYAMPLVLAAIIGLRWFFLFGVPVLGLLVYISLTPEADIKHASPVIPR